MSAHTVPTLKSLRHSQKSAATNSHAVVHPGSATLCTTASDKVSAFEAHYQKLFSAPAISCEDERAQRACSTATVQRLREAQQVDVPELEVPFGVADVDQALSLMANHKAPGGDGLPTELLKYCGTRGKEILLMLFNLIHEKECIPHAWREGLLISVPKTGDLTHCSNYRGLTLLPSINKLFANLLLQRLRPHVQLHDHQYGFR